MIFHLLLRNLPYKFLLFLSLSESFYDLTTVSRLGRLCRSNGTHVRVFGTESLQMCHPRLEVLRDRAGLSDRSALVGRAGLLQTKRTLTIRSDLSALDGPTSP